jgi:hypothetical protein
MSHKEFKEKTLNKMVANRWFILLYLPTKDPYCSAVILTNKRLNVYIVGLYHHNSSKFSLQKIAKYNDHRLAINKITRIV